MRGSAQSFLDRVQFELASDERILHCGLRPTLVTDKSFKQKGFNSFSLALELEFPQSRRLCPWAHESPGHGTQDDTSGWRGAFESSGHIHSIARGEPLAVGAGSADDHTCVDPGPTLQPYPDTQREVVVQLRQRLAHLLGGLDRSQGVVFVTLRQTEHGHDGI